jgi:hypothetical protein
MTRTALIGVQVNTIERLGFEDGTAFSAVAPSGRLNRLSLSIVRRATL